MPVCQNCGVEVTDKNLDQFNEVGRRIVLYTCKNEVQCERNRLLAYVKRFKYTGNCYIEHYSGRDRIVVCEPGSKDDLDCYDRLRSSSRWTFIGRFNEGIPMNWKQVYHQKVREEYQRLLNGYYDLDELANTLATYQWSLRMELREAFLAFIAVQGD